jgi:hypothetical protein
MAKYGDWYGWSDEKIDLLAASLRQKLDFKFETDPGPLANIGRDLAAADIKHMEAFKRYRATWDPQAAREIDEAKRETDRCNAQMDIIMGASTRDPVAQASLGLDARDTRLVECVQRILQGRGEGGDGMAVQALQGPALRGGFTPQDGPTVSARRDKGKGRRKKRNMRSGKK